MTAYHIFDTRSDQERPADASPPSTCAHVWGAAHRTGYLPGAISNLYQRDCGRCKARQIWRGTPWGRLTELVRETT